MFEKMKRVLSHPFKKVWNAVIDPSPRAKVRWSMLGILLLTVFCASLVYPSGYNQVIGSVNNGLSKLPLVSGYRFDTVSEKPFNLGLDLQGGAHLVYEAKIEELGPEDDAAEAIARLRDRIERRVNALGVAEPLVQVAGNSRLVVELAGVAVDEAIDRIGETPVLEFREPNNEPPRPLTEEEQQEIDAYNKTQFEKAQAAYGRVTSGQESFEDVAKETSEDLATRDSGGDLGVITNATHPELVEGIGATRIGRVVSQVIETDNSYEIVRVDDRQAADTEMLVSHLLICYTGAASCDSQLSRDEALAKIQGIANEITTANFSEKAKTLSTDPSASQNSGDLGWLAPAATVESFETAAKALEVGQISEPVETEFGWHLIYKRDQRPFEQITIHRIQFDKQTAEDILPPAEEWKNTGLTGANVVDAQLVFSPQTQIPQVSILFDEEGTRIFSDLTKRYLNREIAIYLDGRAISIPTVQQQITTGEAVISGNFSTEEAQDLARRLKDGALPITVELVQQQTVGATLGADSLSKSMKAGIIGLIFIAVFMILYYRLLGLLAVLALAVYGLTTMVVFKFIGVTLTLSGIAGFILSLGMAVDANVLVFERFKEELARGRALAEAIPLAFKRAWPSIRDGNISTLITCFFLAWFGTTLIKGFAVTLALGVMVSMFSAMVVTKSLMDFVLGWSFIRRFTPLYTSGKNLKG